MNTIFLRLLIASIGFLCPTFCLSAQELETIKLNQQNLKWLNHPLHPQPHLIHRYRSFWHPIPNASKWDRMNCVTNGAPLMRALYRKTFPSSLL